ncbi:conserved hypothetical protein [uncultured Desulfatiglans sp.]|uniref:Polysaccharide deacetylase n=1 Tax=Uncultured Desulfatiglans sp. TaxID=1748965 RepID=A0A653A6S2_UNCDX|nr:conserved hypothetical protein [uncultured Desulfatiglans sp.]
MMNVDFTIKAYKELLVAVKRQGFSFQTVELFMSQLLEKVVVLRHDVDRLPGNSLRMARLEQELGVVATYYFRSVPESWNEGIIQEIAGLGHEVGYHYESLTTCKGNLEQAFNDFKLNLERLRKLVPVSTICMHGSPRSAWDSKDLWKIYGYESLGIAGEPYLDTDFDEVFYLTDTGRRWDGWKVSVRDKMRQQKEWVEQGLVFHSTWEIIRAAKHGKLPDRIMMTVHPQRWTDDPVAWGKELILQNTKNVVKRLVLKNRTKGTKSD